MTRRSFFRTLAAATAGFAILPQATTYQRVWKATRPKYIIPILYKRPISDWKFIDCGSPVSDGIEIMGQWKIMYHDMAPLYDPQIVAAHCLWPAKA